MLPNTKKMLPRLSDMTGMKNTKLGLGGRRKRKQKMTIGRMIRGM